MPATKITDLLPIPSGARQPHPYQVLGLEDGEQDPAVIAAAMQSVVSHLKAAKPETDPKLWNQAARLVKGAKEVLSDPDRKSQLDARFGIVSLDALANDRESSPPDALAAFLPAADPLAIPTGPAASVPVPPEPALPTVNPMAAANPGGPADDTRMPTPAPALSTPPLQGLPEISPINSMPPGLFGTPANPDASDPAAPSIGVVVNAPRTRRKKSLAGTLLFLTFAFGTFGVIGALVYFLIFGPGQVAINTTDGMISISTQPPQDDPAPLVSQPRPIDPTRETPPRDAIMGTLDANDSPSGTALNDSPSGLTDSLPDVSGSDDPPADAAVTMEPDSAPAVNTDDPAEMLPAEPAPAPAPAPAANMESGAPPTMQPTDPEMSPLTDAMIAEAEQGLDRIRKLIRSANWKEMKPSAETLLEQRMSEAQQSESQTLYEVADLASYYRVGIERAIADLKVGNDFEVSEDFRVIVVETSPDRLVVRFNATNRSFTLDQLPWSLAHKLASFTVPNDATGHAAKAVYQAISPNANEAYRAQALQWLEEIQEEVKGANPQQLAETIRNLFEES